MRLHRRLQPLLRTHRKLRGRTILVLAQYQTIGIESQFDQCVVDARPRVHIEVGSIAVQQPDLV